MTQILKKKFIWFYNKKGYLRSCAKRLDNLKPRYINSKSFHEIPNMYLIKVFSGIKRKSSKSVCHTFNISHTSAHNANRSWTFIYFIYLCFDFLVNYFIYQFFYNAFVLIIKSNNKTYRKHRKYFYNSK